MICASDIVQNDAMLDSWSVYLTLYRMMQCWTRDLHLTLYRMMMDLWSVYLTLYRMTPRWTRDLCIWHYTGWKHVGLVICVSDIIQNGFMLDSWSVHLTFYRMTSCWTHDLCIWHYTEWRHVGLMICVSNIIKNYATWTRDLCICHYTEWQHVGLVLCVSDILQNDAMRSRVQRGVILYNVRYTDHESNMASFCIMSDTQIMSPTWRHSVKCQMHRSRVQHGVIL